MQLCYILLYYQHKTTLSVNMSTMCPWMKILHRACSMFCVPDIIPVHTGQSSRHYQCAPTATVAEKCCHAVSRMQSDFKYENPAKKLNAQRKKTNSDCCITYNGEFLILNQIKHTIQIKTIERTNEKKSEPRRTGETENGLYQSWAVLWSAWNRKCENYTHVSRTYTALSQNARDILI